MKKQTMYNRLQNQYTKLNQRIQKSMQTGRFYGYTQFKQEQLLNRLKRFSFQLKQLGAGVAVVAALGMATPVVGQSYNLVQQMGASDHFDGIGVDAKTKNTTFIDIDGDGDLDFFAISFSVLGMQYFENTGSVTNPTFVLQTTNPLGSFSGIYDLAFVDIDGDGDYDAFSTGYYSTGPTAFDYYENTGTPTNPTFALQTGTLNPLDSVVIHLNAFNAGYSLSGFPSFVDIDNDGDQDCFVGVGAYYGLPTTADSTDKLWYYENIGTDVLPDFQRTSNDNNPLKGIVAVLSPNKMIRWGLQFFDGDTDGDYDVVLHGTGGSESYFKNEGTANSAMVQLATGITPLDFTNNSGTTSSISHINYVDIDGDSDFDVVLSKRTTEPDYFKNITPVGINKLDQPTEERIGLYPNPTNGNITLDKAITGQLNVFNITGQKVYSKVLEAAQNIDLSLLEEGTYLLSIEQDEKRFQQTIVIQK